VKEGTKVPSSNQRCLKKKNEMEKKNQKHDKKYKNIGHELKRSVKMQEKSIKTPKKWWMNKGKHI
jgi:hypothetical protein